jgi:cytochrome c oxidase cbb3-type subunit 3
MADKRIDDETGTETTGHQWDGIEELNTPLPRWWLWTFYATVVWGIGYTILFPAWPLVSGATSGLLGFSTRGDVVAEIEQFELSNAELRTQLASATMDDFGANEALYQYAVRSGASVFANNCSQCHGAGAGGVQANGFPNLLDDDWLWGGTYDEIVHTVAHGIRNEQDPDARWSEMPAFGDLLEAEEIAALVAYVRDLGGFEADPALLELGAESFDINCSSCHGVEGMGDRYVGAPNLTDAIWLYGGSEEDIEHTIVYSRFGVMPPWVERIGEANVRAVSAYVHQLGGGENAPAAQ